MGYWLGGRPSAAVPHESARNRADSARFRADPANFRQNYFLADSAERPANVRRTPPDSARIRADPRGVRRELAEEFTRKMSADKNLAYATVSRGRSSAPDDPPPRTIPPRMLPPRTNRVRENNVLGKFGREYISVRIRKYHQLHNTKV